MYRPMHKGEKIVFREYQNGISDIDELVEKTGYKKSTVYYYLSLLGKSNKIKVCKKTKEIIELLEKGAKGSEIARQFNVSRQWVSKLKIKISKGVYRDKEIN